MRVIGGAVDQRRRRSIGGHLRELSGTGSASQAPRRGSAKTRRAIGGLAVPRREHAETVGQISIATLARSL